MNDDQTRQRFTDSEPADVLERPFRPSGLVALVLGVLSAGVVFTGHLLFLPILTLAIGLYACRPATTSRVRPAGRSLAVAGMTLALLFGSWALAFSWVQRAELTADASAFARQWLVVLGEGRREFAFELALPQRRRQLENMSLPEYYVSSNTEAYQEFKAFMDRDVVQAILEAGDHPDWDVESLESIRRVHDDEYIVLRIVDQTGTVPQPILINLSRSPATDQKGELDPNAPHQWYIKDIFYPADDDEETSRL